MQLCLLGTGSPNPLPERQAAAVLLSYGNEHILVDAGRGVTTQLVRAGVYPHELSAILITHHHYDHIGNLGDLLLTAWHGGSTWLPVIGPPGTDQIVQALFEQIYQREIAFSHAFANATATPLLNIQDVVHITTLIGGQQYQQPTWRASAAMVDHGQQLGLSFEQWPCLAYRIEIAGKSIVISGDTIMCDNLIALAMGADVLVQCCFLADADLTTPARQLLANMVIATSGQAGKIAAQAGVKQLVLTHFSGMQPDRLALIESDVHRDYSGQVHLGTDLFTLNF
jgi:ribonuclease BN (tRNA processing enzyme)